MQITLPQNIAFEGWVKMELLSLVASNWEKFIITMGSDLTQWGLNQTISSS